MKLTLNGIKEHEAWENAGIQLPGYDVEKISAKAKEAPVWVHFGIGNIFRVFIGGIADGLLEEGVLDRGITCVETFDYDVVDKIYKVGGAQAVAALAFGTESIPRVDKITGPGNIFVANAKREVFGHVGIDMVAGPSEVLVIADDSANPRYVAADLLSQAEHAPLAAAILVTDSETLAAAVQAEIAHQTALLPRRDVIEKSLTAYGTIVVAPTLPDCADIANQIAPEHMELSVADPYGLLPLIENAGAIFLGHYSPEPLGDYLAGPNHVLPTSGTARFFSPLSVDDFVKKSSLIFSAYLRISS